MKYLIAYDLGTGGTKTSLFDEKGNSVNSSFYACETYFPKNGWHEQRPEDWWKSVIVSTREMLAKTHVDPMQIVALAVSGHSLGVVPMSPGGELLSSQVPIWSDSRADEEALSFFEKVDEKEDELDELKMKMDDAIKTQNFELAAQLRDKIKELEEGSKNE